MKSLTKNESRFDALFLVPMYISCDAFVISCDVLVISHDVYVNWAILIVTYGEGKS